MSRYLVETKFYVDVDDYEVGVRAAGSVSWPANDEDNKLHHAEIQFSPAYALMLLVGGGLLGSIRDRLPKGSSVDVDRDNPDSYLTITQMESGADG